MYNIEIDLYNRPRIFQVLLNTLKPRRNEQHFTDDIFIRIFFNENVWISVKISLTCVPLGPIKNIPAWVQIMTWCRPGDKPLYAPMMVIFFRRIYESRGLNELLIVHTWPEMHCIRWKPRVVVMPTFVVTGGTTHFRGCKTKLFYHLV